MNLILSLSIMVILTLIIVSMYNRSLDQALSRYITKNSLNLETLKKIDISKEKTMFINKNQNNQLNITIANNELIKGWKIEYSLWDNNIGDLDNFTTTDINSNKYNFTCVWNRLDYTKNYGDSGILYGFFTHTNNNYNEIYVSNIKCNIEKVDDNLYLYYIITDPPKYNFKVVE
ncbi:hypothetical protein [Clostridium cibarium]|uniref:Uncharacterized protein n=1 Tax=Clostridium cibarium TaxID=2762247 RepID=A0ABR8PYQ4_9CLOT|nr:hypothetical protein [Clostridium cibarium]MBD7913291.1 hypothetical protein [Clostridium cibarium]